MTNPKAVEDSEKIKPIDIDVGDFDAADESDMTVELNGKLTTWIWTFAGPGHDRTVAQSNRLSRERLHRDREQEASRVNGRKWKADEDTPDEMRQRNVGFVVERLLRWTPIKLNGEELAFSSEAASKLLGDPRKVSLLTQALEFLGEQKSFIRRSATS
jgi:hypothetical protein